MFSKLGVQFLGLGYCIRTKYGMTYPVSCTADCYVMVITLFIKKVAVVRPNFGGSGPPTPSVCALELLDLLWSKVLLMMIVTISLNYWRFFRYLNTVVSTRSVHDIISCTVDLVSIYLFADDMLRLWIHVLKWNNTLLLFEAVCYKKHS